MNDVGQFSSRASRRESMRKRRGHKYTTSLSDSKNQDCLETLLGHTRTHKDSQALSLSLSHTHTLSNKLPIAVLVVVA